MKKYKYLVFIFTITLAYAGCVKQEYNDPAPKQYTIDFTANKSLSFIKSLWKGSVVRIKDDYIVRATVIANDKSGNFYKQIVIQDSAKNSAGTYVQSGIILSINSNGLHLKFPVGQIVYIKCKGLVLGNYGGVVQLGGDSLTDGSVYPGRIEYPFIDDFIYKVDTVIPIKPTVKTKSQLNGSLNNTLITLKDMQFKTSELTKTYADAIYKVTSDITLENLSEETITLRNSGYANFASDSVSKGNGDITVVYGEFTSGSTTTPQLMIRDLDDINFKSQRIDAWFIEDFLTNLGTFTQYSVLGSKVWNYGTHSPNTYAQITGYQDSGNNEDWLISPSIDLTKKLETKLSFSHAINYYTNFSDITVWVSSEYDGTSNPSISGNWHQLTGIIYPPSSSKWEWTKSGDIDLSAYEGKPNIHIAFKYKSLPNKAIGWEIDYVKLKSK